MLDVVFPTVYRIVWLVTTQRSDHRDLCLTKALKLSSSKALHKAIFTRERSSARASAVRYMSVQVHRRDGQMTARMGTAHPLPYSSPSNFFSPPRFCGLAVS